MRANNHLGSLTLASVVLLLTSCSFSSPSRVEKDFGQSVRQMVQEQIYDKQTASSPAVDGPDVLDGETGDSTINEYRKIDEGESGDGSIRITF